MLWTDKYRPQSFAQVVGYNKEKQIIQKWIADWKAGNPQKPLLLIGPPGIGKTTFALIIAKEFSEYIELNASDKRSQDAIKSTVGESSSSRSLFGEEYKLIIMDEVDGIHGTNDRGGVRAIGEIIKNSKHPMILMANDFYSKRLQTIKPKCIVIKMQKTKWNSINALLKKIAKEEEIKANPAAIKEIAVKSKGDVRSAINTLQALSDKDSVLEVSDVKDIITKDDRSTIIDGVTIVLKSQTPAKVKRGLMVEEDPTLVMEYIAENIPREYTKKDEIKKAYENIAKADLYFGRAQSSRYYGYWKYATDFMGIGVSASKHEKYRKFTKIQSPTIFTTMGKNRGKRNLRDGIAEAEIKRFRLRGIPKKTVEKMEKRKAQMRVEERDRRFEELQNQMMEIPQDIEITEEEIPVEDPLPFEIPGIENEEPEVEEIVEEPIEEPVAEEPEKEEKPKKKTDKQVSLFNF